MLRVDCNYSCVEKRVQTETEIDRARLSFLQRILKRPDHAEHTRLANRVRCGPIRSGLFAERWTFNGHIKTAKQRSIIQQYGDWYTGRWWVGLYIWHSEEGPGRAADLPSTVSVPTSYYSIWHYNYPCTLKASALVVVRLRTDVVKLTTPLNQRLWLYTRISAKNVYLKFAIVKLLLYDVLLYSIIYHLTIFSFYIQFIAYYYY